MHDKKHSNKLTNVCNLYLQHKKTSGNGKVPSIDVLLLKITLKNIPKLVRILVSNHLCVEALQHYDLLRQSN